MKVSKQSIGKPLRRIEFFYWGHFSFTALAIIIEIFYGFGLSILLKTFGFGIFYRLLFRMRKKLNYSYWTFACMLTIYLIISFNSVGPSPYRFYLCLCYLLAMVFLSVEMYSLASPIYYPLIRWWEYDFRYRDDLKITAFAGSQKFPGRLTDLRREAGCVALFEKLESQTLLSIKLDEEINDKVGTLEVRVIFRRQYSLGRPYTYGVKFKLPSEKEKNRYNSLVKHWKNRKRLIRKLKYGVDSSP